MRSPSVLPLFLCDTCRRTTGLLCTSSYVPLKQSTQSSPDINGFVLSNMLGLWLRAAGSVERVVQIPFSSSRKLEGVLNPYVLLGQVLVASYEGKGVKFFITALDQQHPTLPLPLGLTFLVPDHSFTSPSTAAVAAAPNGVK
ncbi:predicted protein [Histoplasma mississippiense (nom. inval.)]|uniref:predicted protein n=1 Tax=Ajellomyces capsulatus (strain NAm1 / WU24) TaxID=2059318 RepID=UPI000157D2D1|nr:predicted protein [Histoplasma mississippiense (nom. inval.)]EDN04441.1 predicted protein [Histoplasma mississippiense (nom. inval.)]